MKFIDEKGKVFGLINLLDMLVLAGLVVACYLGVSTFIALKQPPMVPLGVSPEQVEAGKTTRVTVRIKNERYLLAARLYLIPQSFEGSTTILTTRIGMSERETASFKIPGDLRPGQYQLNIETEVTDVFRRKIIMRDVVPGKFVVVEPKIEEVKEAAVIPEISCLWGVSLEAVLLDGDHADQSSAPAGALRDNTGQVNIRLASFEKEAEWSRSELPASLRKRAVRPVRLEMTGEYSRIERLLSARDRSILLFDDSGAWEFYLPGQASAEVDLVIFVGNSEQAASLKPGARSRGPADEAEAEITYSFGAAENPWFSPVQSVYSAETPQPFSVNRVRLNCRIRDGRLYFRGQPLEPDRLIDLELNGQKYTAGVLSKSQAALSLPVKVILQFVPIRMVPLLKPGLSVLDKPNGSAIGTLTKVIEIGQSLPPASLWYDQPAGAQSQFRRLLLEFSLDCLSSGAQVQFNGQPVDYGRQLNLYLLGQPLQGLVTSREHLPAEEKLVWKEVKVSFTYVPPWIEKKLTPGLQEYGSERPPRIRLKSVVSSQPTVIYPAIQNDREATALHPLYKDIVCVLEMQLVQSDDLYYLWGTPLSIGGRISFTTQYFTLPGEVIEF